MARAMAMRCRWPPENSCGKRLRQAGSRRTSSKGLDGAPVPFLAGDERLMNEQTFGDDLARASSGATGSRKDPGTPAATDVAGAADGQPRSRGIRLRSSKRNMPLAGWRRSTARAEGGFAGAQFTDDADRLAGPNHGCRPCRRPAAGGWTAPNSPLFKAGR